MTHNFPPALIFFLGALLIPFFKGRTKQAYLLLIPSLAFLDLLWLEGGVSWSFHFLGYLITLSRVDRLCLVFGYIFVIIAFAGTLFSLHVTEDREHVAAFLYIGSSLGVVFAGDYLSLFIFWEIMAFSSLLLIWFRKTSAAQGAGFRYILVHIFGGLCLLVGILLHHAHTGSIEFGAMRLDGLASYLIFIGFILNAAAPPLHAWLPDAYPEATITGAVFLSAFTTKTAVYVLARSFAGEEILIWLGVVMTLYGIVFAILENDMRRILAYSIINQVGFMVAGIGIGTAMAINGSIAHAFCHILYKALLFMSAGAVLLMTGKSKCTDLGGLYKTMPLSALFCLVGAASISAFPLFSGFVSKEMIITAAAQEKMAAVWLLLTLASAGVFLHAGIKFPYFVFFAKDSGIRTKEPPLVMLLAMGFVAFLCIFLGVFPSVLYRILPYPVEFVPYTTGHVVGQLQILFFSALAFFLLLAHLQRTRTISLDTDWFYRKGADALLRCVNSLISLVGGRMGKVFFDALPRSLTCFSRNPGGILKMAVSMALLHVLRASGSVHAHALEKRLQREKGKYPEALLQQGPIGVAVLWATLFLLAYLLIYYLS